jgi:hypothetical protein
MNTNIASISPVPTEEEAVAIAAAVTLMWPQASIAANNAHSNSVSWRFSGRWWATHQVTRRGRPTR